MSIASGISQFVDGIAPAFQQMAKSAKEKELYEKQLAQVEQMGKYGIKNGQMVPIDPNVKDKDIIPFVNQKAIDDIKSNKSHSIAQKRGELEATAAIMRMQAQQAIRQAANPRMNVQVTPGGPTLNVPHTQVYSVEEQKRRYEQGQPAREAKERRVVRGEERKEEYLDLSKGGAAARAEAERKKAIKEAPETKFFEETGLSPQMLIGKNSLAQETGYDVIDKETKQRLGTVGPLKPGQAPPSPYTKTTTPYVPFSGEKIEPLPVDWVPKPGGAYREGEYHYSPGKTKEGTPYPGGTRYGPHPTGEFLRMGPNNEHRIPYQKVVTMQGIANKRAIETQDAIKRAREMSFAGNSLLKSATNPEETKEAQRLIQKSQMALPFVRQRLSSLGYDPNDEFWKIPDRLE